MMPERSTPIATAETIRLWSLQPLEVWLALQQKGELFVESSHPRFMQDMDFFQEPYKWMRQQMAARIPEYGGGFPWWAYTYKVDLRHWRHQAPVGQHWVRLELRIPRERALLSRYDTWHFVLNRSYLSEKFDGEATDDDWMNSLLKTGWKPGMPLPEPWNFEMRQSWERIFELDEESEEYTVQAVFEVLKRGDVVKVDEYIGTSRQNQGNL